MIKVYDNCKVIYVVPAVPNKSLLTLVVFETDNGKFTVKFGPKSCNMVKREDEGRSCTLVIEDYIFNEDSGHSLKWHE